MSDTIYEVQTCRDVLNLQHAKLQICQARELPKWVCDYQAHARVNVEPAEEEPKQVQPEKKNDECGEGSLVPQTCNHIYALFMGTRNRT